MSRNNTCEFCKDKPLGTVFICICGRKDDIEDKISEIDNKSEK